MKIKNESNRLAKECIVTALIELMKVQDYHSITITQITRKAGVSRMAYYRNYTSKEDILNKYMEEVGISIHEKISNMNTREEILDYYRELLRIAQAQGLYPSRLTQVITRPGLPPKRSLVEFRKTPQCVQENEIVIELERHVYSDEYIALTRDFYQKM